MRANAELEELLKPAVEAESCVLWGIDYLSKARPPVLRVYIDREQGIEVDHCAAVSRQISAILDVEEPISGQFTLEVSSPGSDRPLFTPEHFSRYIGADIRLRSVRPIDGQRRFSGKLLRVTEQGIELAVEASNCLGRGSADEVVATRAVEFSWIDRASLNPSSSSG